MEQILKYKNANIYLDEIKRTGKNTLRLEKLGFLNMQKKHGRKILNLKKLKKYLNKGVDNTEYHDKY